MYIPLKVTTEYSLLKSLIKVPTLVDFCQTHQIPACAMVDDNLYGLFAFYNACKKNNIKPIIGLNITLNKLELYLYAKNYNGYKNLIKILEIKEQRELSIIDLEKYHDDILLIIPYNSKELYKEINFYQDKYLGFSNALEKNNASIITSNTVFIKDIRALSVADAPYLEYLDMIRKSEVLDHSNNYYDSNDIVDENKIEEIVDKLNLEIPKGKRYIPKYKDNIDSYSFLKNLATIGLKKRLNGLITPEYQERLKYELSIINKMGYVDYFLIVYDYVLYAKKQGILCGIRGSAAGSLVSYSIGITDIDPLKYGLVFERFLNPERVTMPDIDIDFDASRREEVITYVKEKYGLDHVALGLTFNTLKSRLVLREVGKLLKINNILLDKFLKYINPKLSLKDNQKIPEVEKYLNNYSELKKVYDISFHLEGLKKNTSIHAAGIVICSVPIDEIIPVHIDNNNLITGVEMEYLEDNGILKMDFLALKNYTTIAKIMKCAGITSLSNINLEDPNVLRIFQTGKTDGIFQFETPLMKRVVMDLKPDCFNDLVISVALGRPGPRAQAEEFILRKKGKKAITYLHPDLESILSETRGILIYQEQIIAILGKIGGYTLAEADLIRRAISKKKGNVLMEEEKRFITKSVQNGYSKEIAKSIYDLIVQFADYGFNKSHSVAYAILAYQMAYLKVYYPEYFLVDLLNNSGEEKIHEYFSYMQKKKIKFYKPNINNTNNNYELSNHSLYLPLWLIKGITKEISQRIINNRADGYTDLFDFAYKNKDFITAELLHTLIKSGAFDSLNPNHKMLDMAVDSALTYAKLQDESGIVEKPIMLDIPDYDASYLRECEKESLGMYISNHPAGAYSKQEYFKLENIQAYCFKKIKTVVLIERINRIKTKKGEDMAFFHASDETSNCDFTVFPQKYSLLDNITENTLIEVNGEVSKRFDKYSIIVNNIRKVG